MHPKILFVFVVVVTFSLPARGVEDKESKLLPVPSRSAQKNAEIAMKEVLKGEFAKAKTPAKKVALAKVLLKYGVETKDDPTARFVLLREARDQAAEVGAFVTALKAVDEMARGYKINSLAMKADVLTQAEKTKPSPLQAESLAEQALNVVEAAMADDQFDVADRMGAVALAAARTSGNRYLLPRAKEHAGQIEGSRKAHEAAKKSIEVLKDRPDDPAANLTVGRYLCFAKDQWAKGLPLLAKADDKKLARAAAQDAAGPKTAPEQVQTADDWLDLAGSEVGHVKYKLLRRAHHWYLEALPGLTGLAKAKITKRIEDVEEAVESSPWHKGKPELHIVADIDGSDWLRISAYEAVWTHGAYQWPSSVKINDLTWKPAEQAQNPKAGTAALFATKVDFTTARLTKIKGRGKVELKRAKDQIEIFFEDAPFGSDIYEVVVTFGKGKIR